MAIPKFIFKTISGQKLRPSGTYYSTILERIPDEGIKPIDIKRADYPYTNKDYSRGWHTDDWRKIRDLGLINMDKRRAFITDEGKRLLKELNDFKNSPVMATDATRVTRNIEGGTVMRESDMSKALDEAFARRNADVSDPKAMIDDAFNFDEARSIGPRHAYDNARRRVLDEHPEFEDRIPRSYDDYYDEFGIDIDD